MAVEARIQSITVGRIEVIPREKRAAAFAKLGRASGRPSLRAVGDHELFHGDPDANDLAVGIYAKVGCTGFETLTGLVAIRERVGVAPPATSQAIYRDHAFNRAFLIEALTVSKYMSEWRPPVRSLLAATAATLVATVYHDPGFRTLVAFRVPEKDVLADLAIADIGGQEIQEKRDWLEFSGFAGIDPTELRFVNSDAARQAAKVVLGHMKGSLVPSQPLRIGNDEETCGRVLTVDFPRAMRHLEEEISAIATGSIEVGWQHPISPINDTEEVAAVANVGSR